MRAAETGDATNRLIVTGAALVALPFLACFPGAWLVSAVVGHGPNRIFLTGIDDEFVPVGPWTHVRDRTGDAVLLPLGASDVLGRDELLRLLYGGRSSLIVAALAAGITASIVALARRRVLRAVAVGSMVAAGAVVFDVLVWGGFGVGSSSTWGAMLLAGANYWTSRPLLLIAPLVSAAVPVTGFVLLGVGLAEAGRRARPRGSLT